MTPASRPRSPAATAAVTVSALLALTACGQGDGTDDETPSTPATATIAGVKVKKDPELHEALPEQIKASGTVRVATDVPYPPFVMFEKEGSTAITGLDYELGQAVGTKLGVKFDFKPQKFDGIVPAIQAGKFDVAISAITDDKERQAVLDFVDYSVSGSGIMVADGNPEKIATLDDLCGEGVAVQAATNQLDLLKSHQRKCRAAGKKKIDIQPFPKDSDAQLALRAGKVVADVLTKPAAGWTAKTADQGNAFDLVEDPSAKGGYGASPNGIAVSKQLRELTEAVRKAVQALMDDGTLKKICAKYGAESIALEKATVNAGKE
ncbi:ABC transporter substrate-binding protein [Streptomyces sp. WMMB 322]|uniref:ABC transporter substrate-binding protein n=1 Tax=Streptomyces sp. WMMB 322 TaxID=1286821 RepID=UPI000823D875|nr:ABC transporter substrate-binding protein [Streptomyces sp. WMMB 322]SCK08766.1 amino acid ABC transporter substrate-binding protein, PAAT family (TC 3.A.1.3.-) [Streptomyces sp. WMMB 322]